jgi:uncharacterized protein YwgA
MQKKMPDILWLVFIANHLQKIEGRKRFQKIVFLLKHFYNVSLRYNFMPYLYGPYCPELQNHIDILVSENVLKAERSNGLFVYKITPFGRRVLKLNESKLEAEEKRRIIDSLNELSTETTEDLVRRSKKLLRDMTE